MIVTGGPQRYVLLPDREGQWGDPDGICPECHHAAIHHPEPHEPWTVCTYCLAACRLSRPAPTVPPGRRTIRARIEGSWEPAA